MLKPIKLKLKSKYNYVLLDEEGLGEIFDLRIFKTSLPKDDFIQTAQTHKHRPIPLYSSDMSVFPDHYLVLQYNADDDITGAVTFKTKEEMLEFFEEE